MDKNSSRLFQELRRAGLSGPAIEAAWPSWWNDDLSSSPSARAELRFALARRLGLDPKPLLGERVEFIWKDKARFKHLTTQTSGELEIISSFGVSVGRIVERAAPTGSGFGGLTAQSLRESILASTLYVDLPHLVSACWSLGVPVVHLRIFPLPTKSMHAMVVDEGNAQGAIMLGRDAKYPAPVAFTLAHEIGHLALGHARAGQALVDVEDPAEASERDEEEGEADAFALTLLTGSPDPQITTELTKYNAPTLAAAVEQAGPKYRVEPGTLALCVGYRQRNWPVVMSALGFLYPDTVQIWKAINKIADRQIDWNSLRDDEQEFLHTLLNLADV